MQPIKKNTDQKVSDFFNLAGKAASSKLPEEEKKGGAGCQDKYYYTGEKSVYNRDDARVRDLQALAKYQAYLLSAKYQGQGSNQFVCVDVLDTPNEEFAGEHLESKYSHRWDYMLTLDESQLVFSRFSLSTFNLSNQLNLQKLRAQIGQDCVRQDLDSYYAGDKVGQEIPRDQKNLMHAFNSLQAHEWTRFIDPSSGLAFPTNYTCRQAFTGELLQQFLALGDEPSLEALQEFLVETDGTLDSITSYERGFDSYTRDVVCFFDKTTKYMQVFVVLSCGDTVLSMMPYTINCWYNEGASYKGVVKPDHIVWLQRAVENLRELELLTAATLQYAKGAQNWEAFAAYNADLRAFDLQFPLKAGMELAKLILADVKALGSRKLPWEELCKHDDALEAKSFNFGAAEEQLKKKAEDYVLNERTRLETAQRAAAAQPSFAVSKSSTYQPPSFQFVNKQQKKKKKKEQEEEEKEPAAVIVASGKRLHKNDETVSEDQECGGRVLRFEDVKSGMSAEAGVTIYAMTALKQKLLGYISKYKKNQNSEKEQAARSTLAVLENELARALALKAGNEKMAKRQKRDAMNNGGGGSGSAELDILMNPPTHTQKL